MTAAHQAGPVPVQISYNTRQAAAATGIAESTLRQLVRQGKLAARYNGASILIDAEDLARYYRSLPSERQVDIECAANRGVA
ncbi:helix-turn-helix domain-containing protein [Nocardia fluminea]|uniref:Excisionase family DNA binding protein n=1 Tax=Nocardia fluminea TaxID=134984 RepID=A0A2N3VGV3_9NOCA|nr:helix-turn-helix domain-containing protein [Nocardia fluminea]PKV80852.1 excisionase family DNA binding protein [Nocardia fluminea]